MHSFVNCQIPEASQDRASVAQQEAFMISGERSEELHFKDILDRSQSYRAERTVSDEISEFLKLENTVALILGGICSGKTLIFDECIIKLLTEGEVVFRLNAKFYDLVKEAESIIRENSDFIIAIDNCFSLNKDLIQILNFANKSGTRVLLAARTLAYDSEADLRAQLDNEFRFKTFDTEILHEIEGNSLISCTDRIGGWGATVSELKQKRRILERDHKSRLSGFLLGIFRSAHIRQRFLSELDMVRTSGKSVERSLIVALYLKSIGEEVRENVLSELMGMDTLKIFKDVENTKSFISYNKNRGSFDLIPSVSARESLKNFFDPKDVTDTIVEAVKNIEESRFEPAFRRLFVEFMRYTQLKQVVSGFDHQDRYFDRLSELWFCNNNVLFWLQWSMAMRDHQKWQKANQYLDEAYGKAKRFEDYNTSHLDDQKAGLILDSASQNKGSEIYLRTFQDANRLLTNLIAKDGETSHNYITVKSMVAFFDKAKPNLIDVHSDLMLQGLGHLMSLIQKKHSLQLEGYVKSTMEDAISVIESIVVQLKK